VTTYDRADPDDPRTLAARIVGLAGTRRLLVALDHDGTLSPLAPRPEAATLARGAADALTQLATVAEVVIISGRGLDDLIERAGDLPVTLVSEHGLRLRTEDERTQQLVPGLAPTTLDTLRHQLAHLLTEEQVRDGWIVEDKGVGVAVHHRLVPDDRLEPTLSSVTTVLEEAAAQPGMDGRRDVPGGHVQTGKAVLELRAAGADKGRALAALLAARPEAMVVMVGDDLTDEPALALAEEVGGVGVLVAAAHRPSSGSARVDDPDRVIELLEALAEALRSARPVSRG
jgi:trehalose 6-phosphate phosphatase